MKLKLLFLLGVGMIALGMLMPTRSIQRVNGNLTPFNPVVSNDVLDKHDSVIRLETTDGRFYCSGAVIDAQYALTAAHCAVNSLGHISDEDIAIYDTLEINTGVIAKAVAIDTLRDVALIRGDFSAFKFAAVDFDGEDVYQGMTMKSCGFPSGDKLWCTNLTHTGNAFFQYRTIGGPIFKGCSGGPVYSTKTGRIIGVNSAVSEDSVIISPLVGFLRNVGF